MGKYLSAIAFSLLTSTAFAELTVEDAYARATPPGQKMSAAFMKLTNNSAKTISLVGATSPVSQIIEVHRSAMNNGVMTMRKLEALSFEPGESKVLQPGGLHLMIIGLDSALVAQSSFDLQLDFADGTQQPLSVKVKSITH